MFKQLPNLMASCEEAFFNYILTEHSIDFALSTSMHIAQVLKLLVRVHKMQICSHFSLYVICNKLILELMEQHLACLNPFCELCMCVNKLKE